MTLSISNLPTHSSRKAKEMSPRRSFSPASFPDPIAGLGSLVTLSPKYWVCGIRRRPLDNNLSLIGAVPGHDPTLAVAA